jgi:hypothetical protein
MKFILTFWDGIIILKNVVVQDGVKISIHLKESIMEMIVKTKEDLEKARKQLPEIIIFEDEMAKKIKKAIKVKKISKIAGIGGILTIVGAGTAIIGGIVTAPVTGGASLGITATGLAGLTATIGGSTIILTTAEVAIVAGVIVSVLGVSLSIAKDLLKHYNIEIGKDKVKFTRIV